MNDTNTTVTVRKPQTHAGYDHRGMSVLPLGPVKLADAGNKMFGSMWDCWKENKGTNFLLEQGGKYKVVHTSGTMESVWVGDAMILKHDQTMITYPGVWRVVASAPHNQDGLNQFRAVSGKSSIIFYTFK